MSSLPLVRLVTTDRNLRLAAPDEAHIPASDREFRIRASRRRNSKINGIAFLRTAALPQDQFSAVYITNIGWRELRHEGRNSRIDYLRRTGIGVFALVDIKQGTPLFSGDNDEMLWVSENSVAKAPIELRRLYEDFAVIKNGQYGGPPTFNRLTMSWYLNEPKPGDKPT